jgi:hypothetical protein
LVFFDQGLREKLPEFKHLFDQWKLSTMTPGLKALGRRSALELLAALEEDHVRIISNHLGTPVAADKTLDPFTVKLFELPVETAAEELNRIKPGGNVSAYREGGRLYLCLWR